MSLSFWFDNFQDVRGRLLSAQSSVQQFRKQLSDSDSCKRDAEQRNQALQRDKDAALRERETAQREKDRLKQERDKLARSVELSSACSPHAALYFTVMSPTSSEKANLEKAVQAAQSSRQMLQMDYEKLQLAVASVQRERDSEREEKEAALHDRERWKTEIQRM